MQIESMSTKRDISKTQNRNLGFGTFAIYEPLHNKRMVATLLISDVLIFLPSTVCELSSPQSANCFYMSNEKTTKKSLYLGAHLSHE
jgi:hypothetical protein